MTKRLVVLTLCLLALTACNRIDHAKFQPAYRAAKAIQAAVDLGNVNYLEYSSLVQALATECAILKDAEKNSKETALAERYQNILTAYTDAGTLWQATNNPGDLGAYGEGLTVGYESKIMPPFDKFAARYGVKIEAVAVEGTSTRAWNEKTKQFEGEARPQIRQALKDPSEAMLKIWAYAKRELALAAVEMR
jgi:hypothetical protein